MNFFGFPAPLWDLIADRFRALGEPTRLHIMYALRGGEKTVSELTDLTGLGQANTSKHLQLLHSLGFVARRKDGLYVYYRLADEDVFQLCDVVCVRLAKGTDSRRDVVDSGERS